MNNKILPIIFSAFFLNAAAGCSSEKKTALPELTQEEITAMSDNANEIAFSFYRKKASGKNENFFFSPYSMRSAFAMAREGAKNETAEQMNAVFSFPSENEELRKSYQSMSDAVYEASKGTIFTQANAFWAEKSYKFLPEYISALKRVYLAAAETADFSKKAEESRKKINSWTEKNTGGIIKDLFAEGTINELTRLVLVNAVYFKGTWSEPFTKNSTFEAEFHLNSGEKSKAQLMRHEESTYFQLGRKDKTLFLAMPYKSKSEKGAGLEMMVILPEDSADFAAAENQLSSRYVNEARASMTREKVRVFFPKFKFSSSHELNNDLKEMGMIAAFTDSADFSGMTDKPDLMIGTAVQKAFIDVAEEGTEAAAATGIAMTLKSAMPTPSFIFRADKPFVFLIRDIKTGLILFMGKVENPKAS